MVRAKLFLCCVASVLVVSATDVSGSSASGTFAVDEPNAVLQTVISALKGIKLPATGRGRAVMTIRNGETRYTDREVVADFVFKNQNSRTDVLVRDDSGALSRFYCDAVSDKESIRVDNRAAMLQRAALHERSIGYDFSPGIFVNVTGYPVTEHLETALHVPET